MKDNFIFLSDCLEDCRKVVEFKNGEIKRMNKKDDQNRLTLNWNLLRIKIRESLIANEVYNQKKYNDWIEDVDLF